MCVYDGTELSAELWNRLFEPLARLRSEESSCLVCSVRKMAPILGHWTNEAIKE